MAANTQKNIRLIEAIQEQLGFLASAAITTKLFDVNDDVYLTVAYSGQTHLVRCKHETAPACGALDGLGLTQRVYTPTIMQLGVDTAAESGGLDADTEFIRAILYVVVASKGTRVEVYAKSGIALTDMVLTDASLVANYNSLYDGSGYMGNI